MKHDPMCSFPINLYECDCRMIAEVRSTALAQGYTFAIYDMIKEIDNLKGKTDKISVNKIMSALNGLLEEQS